jgi:hypothetical protein
MTSIYGEPGGITTGGYPVSVTDEPFVGGSGQSNWVYCALSDKFIIVWTNQGECYVIQVGSVPAAMRLLQRSDGIGVSKHPRINTGGMPNGSASAQLPGSPRIGTNNVMDPGGNS